MKTWKFNHEPQVLCEAHSNARRDLSLGDCEEYCDVPFRNVEILRNYVVFKKLMTAELRQPQEGGSVRHGK